MMLISNLILSVAETDSGRYDCLYNGQLVSSFHIAVDSHRLALACFWQNILEISPIYRTNPKHIFIFIVFFSYFHHPGARLPTRLPTTRRFTVTGERWKLFKKSLIFKSQHNLSRKSDPKYCTNSRGKNEYNLPIVTCQVQPVWEVQACVEDLGEEERTMLSGSRHPSACKQWGEFKRLFNTWKKIGVCKTLLIWISSRCSTRAASSSYDLLSTCACSALSRYFATKFIQNPQNLQSSESSRRRVQTP